MGLHAARGRTVMCTAPGSAPPPLHHTVSLCPACSVKEAVDSALHNCMSALCTNQFGPTLAAAQTLLGDINNYVNGAGFASTGAKLYYLPQQVGQAVVDHLLNQVTALGRSIALESCFAAASTVRREGGVWAAPLPQLGETPPPAELHMHGLAWRLPRCALC